MLEGSRNEAYLDGILDPSKPTQFISAAKFYALDQGKRGKLLAACIEQYGRKPITTVVIGLNIDSDAVQSKLDLLLGQPGLMQQIYYGKATLTDEQVSVIFKDAINERLTRLREIYGADWHKLRINEQIATLSLYFNSPKLVGENTNFKKHIHDYIQTGDELYLRRAALEAVELSNRVRIPEYKTEEMRKGLCLLLINHRHIPNHVNLQTL